jgi:hypothetical protein
MSETTMPFDNPLHVSNLPRPWNKGRLIGQKRSLKPKDVWAIRVRFRSASKRENVRFAPNAGIHHHLGFGLWLPIALQSRA